MREVRYWVDAALDANWRDHTGVPGSPRGEQMGPVRSSRALGMVMIAMHDAFAAATSGMTAYQVTRTAPAGVNAGAAMAAAGYTVLTALCPSQSATLADTWQYYAEDRRPDAASIAFGTLVGNDVLAWRAGDAPFLVESYTPSGLPYDHDVDPLHPGQGFVGSLWGGAPRFLANLQPFAAPPGADASGGFNPDAFYRPARRDRARRYDSLWDAIVDNSESRVWLGVHWRFDGISRQVGAAPPEHGRPGNPGELGPFGGVRLGMDIAGVIAAERGFA